jgi:digeranylgeranylglycerophospholipid reductase
VKEVDVLVVGAGPAGTTAARTLAKAGARVLLVDKKQELGAPIQCSGAVSAHALEDADVTPDDEFVSCPLHGFKVYDAAGNSTTLDYRGLKPDAYSHAPLGYIVDRRRFDRWLATQAERAGAELWLKTEAMSIQSEGPNSAIVQLNVYGRPETVRTRVVVAADGVQSQVGKWVGLRTHIRLSELASCLQFVCDRVERTELLEIVTGHQWAPGGYAWVFPKGHGYVEVGLGVIRSAAPRDARWYLEAFMKNSFMADRFANARVLEVQGGGVPLASPLKTQFADHVILVGDAARHVNPITGGGIHTALRGGVIAGNFLSDVLNRNLSTEAKTLSGYQEMWLEALGNAMWKLYDKKRSIFRHKNLAQQDAALYDTLAGYFHPNSEFRKV